MEEQKKRTHHELQRRFAQLQSEVRKQQEYSNKKPRSSEKVINPSTSIVVTAAATPSRKGNFSFSFSGQAAKEDVGEGLQMSQATPTATPSKEVNEILIPYMAPLVQSSDASYWLPATVWFCGLLSGKDSPVAKVLEFRLLPRLILFLTEENVPELQVEAATALRYIASGTSNTIKVTTDQAHNNALWHLLHSEDDVLVHACCSLGVLSGCENLKIRDLVRECGLYTRLLELIKHPTLVVAALRTLGNIVEGNEYLIDCMIRDKVLVYLRSCLYHEYEDVRNEACWIISYVTAGKGRWIQDVFDADLLEALVNLIMTDKFVMEPALRAISNATADATPEQIGFLVSKGCMEPLCYLFCCKNEMIVEICLEGIDNVCKAGELEKSTKAIDSNPYVERIDEIEGWGVLVDSADDYEIKLSKKCIGLYRRYKRQK